MNVIKALPALVIEPRAHEASDRIRWMSAPPNENHGREGPWTRTIAVGTVILVVIGLIGLGVFSGGSSSNLKKQESSTSLSATTTTHPPPPLAWLFLYKAPHTAYTAPGNGGLEGGLANVAGASFEHSVRQIYTASCCSDTQSVTYSIPEGYHRFQAWIGLETGGNYSQEQSLPVLFEVDAGSITNRIYMHKMDYGVAAAHINLDISGQSDIVLQTKTDAANCRGDCEAGAVWGNAQLTP